MAPSALIGQLKRIGQMLNRWGAEVRFTIGLALFLVLLEGLALTDIVTRYQRGGRILAWVLLLVLIGVIIQRIMKILSKRHTPESVAVCVERTFPQLDNHLINYLLFSAASVKDALMSAYIKMEIPYWSGLDFTTMKDKKMLHRAQIALAVAVVLLAVPYPFLGKAWTVAMWRIVNPFSNVVPVSLTHILSVSPGDVSILQGGNITVSCVVEGKSGHEVWLDVRPADGVEKTYKLGTLQGRGQEGFSNTFFKVTTAQKYRFRAGDAYTPDWNMITLRPPLAFAGVSLSVVPPSYMNLPSKKYDAQSKAIDIPSGSDVKLAVQCNAPLRSLALSGVGALVELERKSGDMEGVASLKVTNGVSFVIKAMGTSGDGAETTLGFNLLPDRPPELKVKFPQKLVVLLPGGAPSIDFSVMDDFGLGQITIEQIPEAGGKSAKPIVLKTFKGSDLKGKEFSSLWKGEIRKATDIGTMTLRVVAKDNSERANNVTVSPSLVFASEDPAVAAKKREEQEKKSADDLNRVIELQRANIAKTKQLQGALKESTPEQWGETATCQESIRAIVKTLIEKGSGRSLGNLLVPIKKLYINEIADVIPALRGVSTVRDEAEKGKQVARALSMEEKILRQLTFADDSSKQVKGENSNGTLLAILDGIIFRQDKIIKITTQCSTQGVAVAASVTGDQDALGSEVTVFINACRNEAAAGKGEDKDQSAFLESVAFSCEQDKIKNDMMLAAEKLEKNAPREAMPHEKNAYGKLLATRQKFEQVQTKAEKEKNEEMIEAIQIAKEKLDKLATLEKKLQAEMDKVAESKNKDTKKIEMMEQEATEMKKNIKDAMLQIPKDLEIFASLNAGNDLVEDVFTTFEEVKKSEDGEGSKGGPVDEFAYAKREELLDAMEKAKGLIDDFEMRLGGEADKLKITTESFDKTEMPEGVALVPLQTEANDIIGDLIKQDEEEKKKADDGAINQATPDMEMGDKVMEGSLTSFAAKGKSGNTEPDHKEQDGRSNVGRQGMSSGETAASSGTIGEGDKNIEARRTKDPTQSGMVTADGEADTKATGGGKLGSGKGDGWGDSGGNDLMTSKEAGAGGAESLKGMAKRADDSYAQASMKGLKADALKNAAHHIRQAADAISKGAPIGQIQELKRRAIGELKKATTELGEGAAASLDGRSSTSTLTDVVEAAQDMAPEKYRELVSDYYKKLNETM